MSRHADSSRRPTLTLAANPLRRGGAPSHHPLLRLVDVSGPLVPTVDSAELRVDAAPSEPPQPAVQAEPEAAPVAQTAPVAQAEETPTAVVAVPAEQPAATAAIPAPTWSANPAELPAAPAETAVTVEDAVPAEAPSAPTWSAIPADDMPARPRASEEAVVVVPLPPPGDEAVVPEVPPPGTSVATVAELMGKFRDADYRFEDVAAGRPVPRIIIRRFPPDLRDEEAAEGRKMMFLQALLPIVLYKNQEIRRDRERLLAIRDLKPADLSDRDSAWLDRLYGRYRVEVGDMDELVERVDVIPPSLALAQAATESGWGTSRSAREGNALFGQYADDGESYSIRSFDALLKSAQSYALNLNTHRSYRAMRQMRADLRDAGKPLDGYVLAATLNGYSELGKKYVRYVQRMIKENRLSKLDQARLVGEDAALASAAAD